VETGQGEGSLNTAIGLIIEVSPLKVSLYDAFRNWLITEEAEKLTKELAMVT
jgi:hypothetical protein